MEISRLLQSNPPSPSPPAPAPRRFSAQNTPTISVRPRSSRKRLLEPMATEAKRQSKWTPAENKILRRLRGEGMKWDDISTRLPGRSAISCRLHFQNYLEKEICNPDEERKNQLEQRKNQLARLYHKMRKEMWTNIAQELGVPWRTAEAMHWALGEQEMARRAGVPSFALGTLEPPPQPTLAGGTYTFPIIGPGVSGWRRTAHERQSGTHG